MQIEQTVSGYRVRRIEEKDIPDVYGLCRENTLFYQYCPPFVSVDTIREDIKALPPGKAMEDKYYIGFWDSSRLIAVMDLILGYPDGNTALIGFFMVRKSCQGSGVGSAIVQEMLGCLAQGGFSTVRLAYAKGNGQSRSFWLKNGFLPTGEEKEQPQYTQVVMARR